MTVTAFEMPHFTCGRCCRVEPPRRVNGLDSPPEGWSELVLVGRPILNLRLCAECYTVVRDHATTHPDVLLKKAETKRERTWQRGYDAGYEEAGLDAAFPTRTEGRASS